MGFGFPAFYTTALTCLITYIAKQRNSQDFEVYKYSDVSLNDTYDFIIIGAGSAGSVVANRLSEVNDWKILLVEAGGEEDVISDVPLLSFKTWNTEKDWNFTTVQQKHVCKGEDGFCGYTAGRVLGGGSAINVMNYVRGNRFNYDNWKDQGNEGWGYDDVLPYFLKSENIRIKELIDSKYHSDKGHLTVDTSRYTSPISEDFIEAAKELGYKYGDYNGEVQNRISHLQYTMRDGARCSSAKAFLSEIKNRPNIHISKNTLALKLILNAENNIVEGVKLLKDGKECVVKPNKEVILSAGAINTPKLLMLSGIGPKNHLKEVDIETKIDLPVGECLFDHLMTFPEFKVNESITFTLDDLKSVETLWEYAESKSGPLSASFTQVVGHLSFNKTNDNPDVQLMMGTTASFTNHQLIKATVAKVQPLSVGNLKLNSSDPFDPPLIDPKFLEDPKDLEDTIKGCLLLIDIMSTHALSKYNPTVFAHEDSPCDGKQGEDYCKCIIIHNSSSMYHPSGTAKMGKDGVVCPKLRVHGVKNLRVIDNSIMPSITSGNTNAPAIMIGEKGSDIIKIYHNITTTTLIFSE